MDMSLVITKGNYGSIGADDFSCNGYYIILFYSYPYTLQSDFNVYGPGMSSGEMVCKVTYYFIININSHYYVSTKNISNNTIFSLSKIIKHNVNVELYDSNDFDPSYSRKTHKIISVHLHLYMSL